MSENETEIPKRQRPRFFWRNLGILCAGVSAAIVVFMFLLASYALLSVNNHFASALSQLTDNVNESKNKIDDVEKTAMNAAQSVQQNSQALNVQAETIAELRKEQKTSQDDFLINEAYYLVKLANDNLQYENNISMAIKLLQSADQNFTKISSPKTYSVRAAFAADLVALQNVPKVDVTGLYVRLSALNGEIDKLPLIMQLLNKPVEAVVDVNNEELPWWRRGLNSIKDALLRIVIVRKNLPNVPPFIAPDQQTFFYQSLHTELEKAQWGLLHHQQDIYRLSLLQASSWIKQYVDNSPIKTKFLQDLGELQLIDVHPNVPTLTNSLQALQNYK